MAGWPDWNSMFAVQLQILVFLYTSMKVPHENTASVYSKSGYVCNLEMDHGEYPTDVEHNTLLSSVNRP
jgi:hypothetical protein